jgi:hypothetical protein
MGADLLFIVEIIGVGIFILVVLINLLQRFTPIWFTPVLIGIVLLSLLLWLISPLFAGIPPGIYILFILLSMTRR